MMKYVSEPYRMFFPVGVLFLLVGSLLWLPQLWNPSDYPVLLHRFCMLGGFTSFFIAGFLMTAVPKFSQTRSASVTEVILFLMATLPGIWGGIILDERLVLISSILQPLMLLIFLATRIFKRKANPPFTFVFIPVGLLLWIASGVLSLVWDPENFKNLHYEGAISAIILGVGSRLLPGILGHTEIVSTQRQLYERPLPLIKTIPTSFLILVMIFTASYFIDHPITFMIRALIVTHIAFSYWRLHKLPKDKTALTFGLWVCGHMIMLSFILRAVWDEGGIHASHAFFISGIVLLSLLIATRVLQSHGPQDKNLERSRLLYVVLGMIVLAALTRVSAYLMPETYQNHLAYSGGILGLAVLLWSGKYLKNVLVFSK